MENNVITFTNTGDVRTWSELLYLICNRPYMFTVSGSFDEVCAWLQGFIAGLNERSPELTENWTSFIQWLHHKYKYPANYSWCHIIRELYPDETTRLESLNSLFTEFMNSL